MWGFPRGSQGIQQNHDTVTADYHSPSMKKATFFTLAAAAALLTGTSAAKAAVASPALVTPGDTFTFDIAGFNSTSGVGYVLGTGETTTFGTTQTFTAAGYNGQNYTITSGETVSGLTTTDTFTVSTPTNFLTTANVSGTKITALQLDIGDANSGVGVATGANTVDYSLAVTGNTQAGSILYGTTNTSFALTPTTTLSNNNLSLAAVEGVNYGSTAISGLAVHSFTYSVTYNTVPTAVPEPSAYAAAAAGALVLGTVLMRRHRRQAAL